jgi:hypothetical protein
MPSFSHSGPAARNGIFECRDRAPKFVAKCAKAHRDKNLRIEWPEIPAETAYLQSDIKFAVRRLDGEDGRDRTANSPPSRRTRL